MGYDNNELVPDRRQLLPFYDGDKIYIQITLQKPNVVVNPNSATSSQQAYGGINSAFDSTKNYTYTLEITLGPPASFATLFNILGDSTATILGDINTYTYTVDANGNTSIPLSAANAINDTSKTIEQKSAIRSAIVDTLFSVNGGNSITIAPSDLGINLAGITNLIVYNAATVSDINVADITATSSVYINLNSIGKSIRLYYTNVNDPLDPLNAQQGIITQISSTQFKFAGQTYNLGSSFTFAEKAIVVGSVLGTPIQAPVDPDTVTYDAEGQKIVLSYPFGQVNNVLSMAYRIDGAPWVNGAYANHGFYVVGDTIEIRGVTTAPVTATFDVWFPGATMYRRKTVSFMDVTPVAPESVTYDEVNKTIVLTYADPLVASIVSTIFYGINDGVWSPPKDLNNGFTTSGTTVTLLDVPFKPNKIVMDIISGMAPAPIHVEQQLVPYVTPVAPLSVDYDIVNQQLVVNYADVATAGSISRIDYFLEVDTVWDQNPSSGVRINNIIPLVQVDNTVVIPNVYKAPSQMRVIGVFNGSPGADDTTLTVNLLTDSAVVTPQAASSIKWAHPWDANQGYLVLTYPSASVAAAITSVKFKKSADATTYDPEYTTVNSSDAIFSRRKNVIYLYSGINIKPNYLELEATFIEGIHNYTTSVQMYYVAPAGAIDAKYDSATHSVRLEYTSSQIADSIGAIQYDTFVNGDWTGFNTVIRSGNDFVNFTRDDKYIYISGIPSMPETLRLIAFFDGYQTPDDNQVFVSGEVPGPSISPVSATSVVYDSDGQQLVLTYADNATASAVQRIDIQLIFNGVPNEFTNDENFTVSGNQLYIPNISQQPDLVRLIAFFNEISGSTLNDHVYQVTTSVPSGPSVSPVQANSVVYDSANQRLVLTYSDNTTASAIVRIDRDINVNGNWSGFVNDAPFTISGNQVYLTGIPEGPVYANIVAFFGQVSGSTLNQYVYHI